MEDIVSRSLSKLIEFIESASPIIWEAAQRQVIANIVGNVVLLLLLVALIIVFVVAARKLWLTAEDLAANKEEVGYSRYSGHPDPENYYGGAIGLYSLAAIVLACVTPVLLVTVKMIVNPQYYSILEIMKLVPLP